MARRYGRSRRKTRDAVPDGINRRDRATPSEGILVDNTPEDLKPEFNDERAMLAVLDDVDRLAGFNEPRRVWGTS